MFSFLSINPTEQRDLQETQLFVSVKLQHSVKQTKKKKSLKVAKFCHESLECRRKYMQTHKITFKSDKNQTLAVF